MPNKRINIMTSTDDNLAMYILPQLAAIGKNLRGFDVHFYLAQRRVSPGNIRILRDFAKKQGINFESINVPNGEFFDSLVLSGGGQWPGEAYFALRVQDYLPEDVDRVMYIDAADVLINGDISPYYFGDFEGNSIIATALSFKKNPQTGERELYTSEDILAVAKGGIFNSGSYVINVDKFRNDGYSIDDYLYLADVLRENTGEDGLGFYGDQGFFAAAFVGDVKYYGYPEHKDPKYMPYNFRSSYWGQFRTSDDPPYTPVVIHYALVSKPWVVRFSKQYIDNIIDRPDFVTNCQAVDIGAIAFMTAQHLRLCELWWKYAQMTPIYEEADLRAKVTANSWALYYLPVCEEYNELVKKLNSVTGG